MGEPDRPQQGKLCNTDWDTFADMIENTTRELENSIFTDERLEKRITAVLKKKGLRVLYTYFFYDRRGEI